MLRENSRKWKSDDRKVMNWEYHAKDNYYINPVGVRFNFKRYAYRNDKDGFHRDFKVYQAEKCNDFLHSLAAHFLFYWWIIE